MKSLANEFFKTMADGARKHEQESRGQYTLVVNGIKDERDLAQQVQIMDQMIAQKVDAIFLMVVSTRDLQAQLEDAKEAGIPVFGQWSFSELDPLLVQDYTPIPAADASALAQQMFSTLYLDNPEGDIEVADEERELIEEYDRRYPLDPDAPGGSPKVIRTGEPELMSEIPDAFWAAVAPDPAAPPGVNAAAAPADG